MIKKIAALADIHIERSIQRHQEYREVFKHLQDSLQQAKPDRIVVVGDLYHNYIDLEGEALVLAKEFLVMLAEIAEVRITRGNHDIRKKNLNRKDTVETVTEMIGDSRIQYYKETGFYEDDNVVWAVWHHPDHEGPYKQHKKQTGKIYIDLFHDPVDGSVSPTGLTFNQGSSLSVKELKGDYSFLGDIHLRQFVDKHNKKAYSGSLIQRDFSERLDDHGYLLWDIELGKSEAINIENNWSFHNIDIKSGFDYDKVNIDVSNLTQHNRLKVRWTDTRSNVNKKNWSAIREYLRQRYNPERIEFSRNIVEAEELTVDEKLRSNITDKAVQHAVFEEFLKTLGCNKDKIDKILQIDEIISKRLEQDDIVGYEWEIFGFWFNNFKSYGDNNFIWWKNKDGIIQITGTNQQGKTTILDAICYALYGKTIATQGKEKFGDNRYINNKRDLDYCNGGVIVRLNSEIYFLYRETNRKWNRAQTEMTECSTKLEVYDITHLDIETIESEDFKTKLKPDDILTGERLTHTQHKLNLALGSFVDFVRIVLTTADNLNDLLSINRSVFIDAISRDAGYDIFEKKLKEFKEHKEEEEQKEERIVLNIEEEQKSITELNQQVFDSDTEIKSHNEESVRYKKEKIKLIQKKETILGLLIKIDDEIANLDVEQTKQDINKLSKEQEQTRQDIDALEQKINSLPKAYDEKRLQEITVQADALVEQVKNVREKISKHNITLTQLQSEQDLVRERKQTQRRDYCNSIKTEASQIDHEIALLKSRFIQSERTSQDLREDITELQNSKVCITCKRDLGKSEIEKIQQQVLQKEEKLSFELQEQQRLSDSQSVKQRQAEEKRAFANSLLSSDEGLPEDLQLLLVDFDKQSITIKQKEEVIRKSIEEINKEELKCKLNLLNLEDEEIKIGEVKKQVEEASRLQQETQHHIVTLENIKLKIDREKTNLRSYEKAQQQLINNEKTQKEVNQIQEEVNTVELVLEKVTGQATNLEVKKERLTSEIVSKKTRIEKYQKQLEKDETWDLYQRCVHRDGLPTLLLKKSVNIINRELEELLSGQDFIAYFDDNLDLRLSSTNRLDVSQNAIESSGKERTFIALALKLALRTINNKSRPNFILLDEITGKLIEKSVDEFFILLDKAKEKVGKVVIIEHVHPINYDWQIVATKNELEVSSLIMAD